MEISNKRGFTGVIALLLILLSVTAGAQPVVPHHETAPLNTGPYIQYDTLYSAICDGDTFTLGDSSFTQTGTYTVQQGTTDSITETTVSLTVNPAYHFYADDTICGGTSYPYFDSVYTTSGQHVYTLLTAQGCDSAYHLNLTFLPRYDFYDTVFLCRQEPYNYNGQTYYAPDIITDSFVTVNGCDSLYYTVLQLHDSLFAAHWEISDDTLHWTSLADTLWEGCAPYTLYFRNRSPHAASGTWTLYNNDTVIRLSDPIDSTTYLSHAFDVGRHYFYLTVTDANGCTDTLVNPTGVSVLPSPTASFYWDSTLVSEIHPFTTFHNTSVPLDSTCSSLWLIGKQPDSEDDLDSLRETHPTYQWNIEGVTPPANYLVWLIHTQQQIGITGDTLFCSDTTQDTIKLMPCSLEYANIVTPNGDGVNDIFKIKNLLEYGRFPYNKLIVYDRWGHEVYKVVNISQESDFWDPNLTGSPTGTYYYRFTGTGRDGAVQHNGVIEVLNK